MRARLRLLVILVPLMTMTVGCQSGLFPALLDAVATALEEGPALTNVHAAPMPGLGNSGPTTAGSVMPFSGGGLAPSAHNRPASAPTGGFPSTGGGFPSTGGGFPGSGGGFPAGGFGPGTQIASNGFRPGAGSFGPGSLESAPTDPMTGAPLLASVDTGTPGDFAGPGASVLSDAGMPVSDAMPASMNAGPGVPGGFGGGAPTVSGGSAARPASSLSSRGNAGGFLPMDQAAAPVETTGAPSAPLNDVAPTPNARAVDAGTPKAADVKPADTSQDSFEDIEDLCNPANIGG